MGHLPRPAARQRAGPGGAGDPALAAADRLAALHLRRLYELHPRQSRLPRRGQIARLCRGPYRDRPGRFGAHPRVLRPLPAGDQPGARAICAGARRRRSRRSAETARARVARRQDEPDGRGDDPRGLWPGLHPGRPGCADGRAAVGSRDRRRRTPAAAHVVRTPGRVPRAALGRSRCRCRSDRHSRRQGRGAEGFRLCVQHRAPAAQGRADAGRGQHAFGPARPRLDPARSGGLGRGIAHCRQGWRRARRPAHRRLDRRCVPAGRGRQQPGLWPARRLHLADVARRDQGAVGTGRAGQRRAVVLPLWRRGPHALHPLQGLLLGRPRRRARRRRRRCSSVISNSPRNIRTASTGCSRSRSSGGRCRR